MGKMWFGYETVVSIETVQNYIPSRISVVIFLIF